LRKIRSSRCVAGRLGVRRSRLNGFASAAGIVNPYNRHPSLIAMEFAALDELANGRALLVSVRGSAPRSSDWDFFLSTRLRQ